MGIVKPGFANRLEAVGHETWVQVEKWDADQVTWVRNRSGVVEPRAATLRAFVPPSDIVVDDTPNLTTTNGLGRLTSSLTGAAPVVFSAATTTCIGVGDSATAALPADADLNAATNKYYTVADATPTRQTVTVTNDTIQVVATFISTVGNFVWNEWGLVLVTSAVSATTLAGTGTSPILFNHKVAALGTKASGASWAFTAKLSWS